MNDNLLKLNIGAGQTHIPGFINVDISTRADISIDLGREKLPLPDDSAELIFSYHTLEHIDNYLFALGEIHRVLRHGGHFLLGVPYVTLSEYHLVNPYHRHNFNEFSFDFFDPARLKGSAAEENNLCFRKIYHEFHYLSGYRLLPRPVRDWCRRHLFNVVREIEFGLVAIKSSDVMSPFPDPSLLRAEFSKCLQSRRAYQ